MTYRFSLGVVKDIVKNALENSGIKNPDEVIVRHEATIILLRNSISKVEADFESYKRETDKTIAELKRRIGKS